MQEFFIRDLEGWSAIMTIIGYPAALLIFLLDRAKERQLQEEGIYNSLSDSYREFLELTLKHNDLGIMRPPHLPGRELNSEQKQRQFVLFGILIAILEQAYILVYEDRMNRQATRLWLSWEDYIREWCQKREFREALPELLLGEDPDFVAHVQRIALEQESAAASSVSRPLVGVGFARR